MRRLYCLWLVVLSVLWSTNLFAEDSSCAKVSAEGENCDALKVTFDLKDCGDRQSLVTATVTCNGTDAKAVAKTDRAKYLVKFSSKSEWGKTVWTPGAIALEKAPQSKKKATKDPVTVAPVAAVTAGTVLAPAPAPATESTAAAAAASASVPVSMPASTSAPAVNPVQLGGFIDFSYMKVFNNAGAVNQAVNARNPGNVKGRIYDQYNNSLQPNLVELTLKRTGVVSYLVDFDFGTMADMNAAGAVLPNAEDDVLKHVGQAVLSYAPTAAPWFLLEVGKLPTHVGYELMKARDNWQYSRSMTYGFGMPVFHTGVHLGFTLLADRQLSAGLYFYNGWNSIYDVNSGKTLGTQLKWTPSPNLSVYYNGILGPEQADRADSIRTVHEFNAVYTGIKDLALAFEVLKGAESRVLSDRSASWTGVSGHIKWSATPTLWISPRLERYADPDGYTLGGVMYAGAVPRTVYSYTLTFGQTLAEGLEARLEGRHDRSTQKDYLSMEALQSTQTSVTGALLYSF